MAQSSVQSSRYINFHSFAFLDMHKLVHMLCKLNLAFHIKYLILSQHNSLIYPIPQNSPNELNNFITNILGFS